MTFQRLEALQARGVHYDLTTTRALMKRLGNPQKEFAAIHVGGTNGKGMCTYALAKILEAGGIKTGAYLSPHVQRLTERFLLGSQEVTEAKLRPRVKEVLDEADAGGLEPTYFEALTAAAFLLFRDSGVEHPVIEVGVGGRLDATNVLDKTLLSVITNIGADHMPLLGTTLEAIAKEKAGIIRPKVPVLTGAEGLALKTIWGEAAKHKAPMRVMRSLGLPHVGEMTLQSSTFTVGDVEVKTDAIGDHNVLNLTMAIHAANQLREVGLKIAEGAEEKALRNCTMTARMQVLRESPAVIVDGAHNPDSCRALRAFVKRMEFERVYLLIGVLADKDYGEMMRILGPLATEIFVSEPDSPRALNIRALEGEARRYCSRVRTARDRATALRTMLGSAGSKDVILCTGSFYTAASTLQVWPEVEGA